METKGADGTTADQGVGKFLEKATAAWGEKNPNPST